MGLHILSNKNEKELRLLWSFKFVRFPPKLGVKISDITTLYGYEYIPRSTRFKSPVSCAMWKVWKKLVHSVTLHCSHISRFFMIFLPIRPRSWQDRSLQFLCLFCGRWQIWLLRQSFYAPVCELIALVVIFIFFWWYLCLLWLYLLSSHLVFFHQSLIYMGSDFCRQVIPMKFSLGPCSDSEFLLSWSLKSP